VGLFAGNGGQAKLQGPTTRRVAEGDVSTMSRLPLRGKRQVVG
jgi:hypothetical protein